MTVCEPCHYDMVAMRTLYTRIVTKHPSLRKVPIGQVMSRLWDWYEKHPTVPQDIVAPSEPVAIPIGELKDIF